MKNILTFLIILLLSLSLKGQRTYQGVDKVSFFGLNSAGLTAALAALNNVEIDQSITLSSAVTVPYGKTITITNGSQKHSLPLYPS